MKKNKRLNKFLKSIIGLSLIAVVIGVMLDQNVQSIFQWGTNYTLVVEGEKSSYSPQNSVKINGYKDYYIKCEKSGVKLIDISGNVLWDQPISMTKPETLVNGDYILVGDLDGNEIILLNEEGVVSRISTKYDIIDFDVNKRGEIVVTERYKNENFVSLYNNKGNKTINRRTSFDKDGVPLVAKINDDGTRLITSFLKFNGQTYESVVTFFDLTSEGQAYPDKIMGSKVYSDTIISAVETISNEFCFLIGDKRIESINLQNDLAVIYTYEVNNKISKYTKFDNNKIAIAFGKSVTQNSKELEKKIVIYDVYGNELKDIKLNYDITLLRGYNNSLVIGDNMTYTAYNKSLKKEWTYQGEGIFRELIPFLNHRKVLGVGNNYTVWLKKEKR